MNRQKIEKAKEKAEQLIAAVDALFKRSEGEPGWYLVHGSKESGALRRASLDLTRALAEMRKPD